MGDSLNFKAWAVINGVKQRDIADALGVSLQSVNNKMNGRGDFTLRQIKKLNKKYGVSADIFLH